MRRKRIKVKASPVLTVLGFLFLSAAAAVFGLLVSVLLAVGLGLAVAGVSALVLGWLAEEEPR